MRFGSILDVFKGDNWTNELVGMISEMIDLGAAMFEYTRGVIVDGGQNGKQQVELYDRDKRINKLERTIRRRVISHLSISDSRADVPSALIFMNVVKDGERIGDYIKNLYEVGGMMPADPDRALYHKYLDGATEQISGMFDKTRRSFAQSDAKLAGEVIQSVKHTGKECEKLIRELVVSDLKTNDAVCLVLVLRFYKRMLAHMGNIATTVVMPVDLIDFYDEPEK